MSEENVDVVRRSFDAWNQTDWEQLQAIYAPDVIVVAPPEWPEPEGARGWEEWRLQIERLKESWEVEWLEVDEIRPCPMAGYSRVSCGQRVDGQAASGPTSQSPSSPPSGTVKSGGSSTSSTSTRPSKPPAVGVGDVGGERGCCSEIV
jgi:hypothetical protein